MAGYAEWVGGLARSRAAAEERRRRAGRLRDACARALVRGGASAAFDPDLVLAESGPGDCPPGSRMLEEVSGGFGRVVGRVREGGLFREGEFGAWCREFVGGLELSGAMRRRNAGAWELKPAGSRPWLEEDLRGLPCSGVLRGPWRPDGQGRRKLRLTGFWVGEGAEAAGARGLAGLLAGGVRERRGGETWLRVPVGAEGFLRGMGVPAVRAAREGGGVGARLLVSPFWGALCSGLMPPACREAALGVPFPAQCPLLPAACWRAFVGGRGRCRAVVCGRGLPFLCGRRALAKRGVRARDLAGMAFSEFGMPWVGEEVRGLMLEWAGRACGGCPEKRG